MYQMKVIPSRKIRAGSSKDFITDRMRSDRTASQSDRFGRANVHVQWLTRAKSMWLKYSMLARGGTCQLTWWLDPSQLLRPILISSTERICQTKLSNLPNREWSQPITSNANTAATCSCRLVRWGDLGQRMTYRMSSFLVRVCFEKMSAVTTHGWHMMLYKLMASACTHNAQSIIWHRLLWTHEIDKLCSMHCCCQLLQIWTKPFVVDLLFVASPWWPAIGSGAVLPFMPNYRWSHPEN